MESVVASMVYCHWRGRQQSVPSSAREPTALNPQPFTARNVPWPRRRQKSPPPWFLHVFRHFDPGMPQQHAGSALSMHTELHCHRPAARKAPTQAPQRPPVPVHAGTTPRWSAVQDSAGATGYRAKHSRGVEENFYSPRKHLSLLVT